MTVYRRMAIYCVLGGLCFTYPALSAGHIWSNWLSGAVTVASLVPVVRFGSRQSLAQFGMIALALIVVGLACTLVEGALFFPQMRNEVLRDLISGSVSYLVAAALLVMLARLWQLPESATQAPEHRSVGIAIPMVLLSALSYVVYYLVFGGITYQFFTKQYYPHAAEQVAAIGPWFWPYQFARGIVMVLAILPVVYTLRLSRWRAALAVGLLLWIVGGGAALLVPNTAMVPAQRFAHIVEIMTQNVSLGITTVLLLRRKPSTARAVLMQPVPTV